MCYDDKPRGEVSPNQNGPGGATNTVTRGLAPQEGVAMKSNPYRHDPEFIIFDEIDWMTECAKAERERDRWQDRAYALERQLEELLEKVRSDALDGGCCSPTCTKSASSLSRVGLCRVCSEVASSDVWEMHMDDARKNPSADWTVRRSPDPDVPWVVYYIQMGDRVKIGRTIDIKKRMKTFYAQPEQLLAVEPGVYIDGVDRERQRHQEFAEWRVSGTELFEWSDELRAHIKSVVAMFGEPSQYLEAA